MALELSLTLSLPYCQGDFIASFRRSADALIEEVEGSQGMQKKSAGSSLADKDAAIVTIVDAIAGSQHGTETRHGGVDANVGLARARRANADD